MIEAFVKIIIGSGKEESIVEELKRIGQIKAGFVFLGDVDVMVQVEAENERALSEIVLHQIGKIQGIEDTDTLIVTKKFKK